MNKKTIVILAGTAFLSGLIAEKLKKEYEKERKIEALEKEMAEIDAEIEFWENCKKEKQQEIDEESSLEIPEEFLDDIDEEC